jgi:signal transduction histidine kinase
VKILATILRLFWLATAPALVLFVLYVAATMLGPSGPAMVAVAVWTLVVVMIGAWVGYRRSRDWPPLPTTQEALSALHLAAEWATGEAQRKAAEQERGSLNPDERARIARDRDL